MNYLVTGGAGFIGSNLVRALAAAGHRVRVLDNFATGKRANLARVQGDLEIVEGDLRSYHLVAEAVVGVDYVLHQAALPSVPRSVRDPITTTEVNVMGTLNLLHAAKSAQVRRVVMASSSSVYGANPELPKHEDMCPQPVSPYAISKLTGEQLCRTFTDLYGLETVALRYFNVFGPRQDPASQYAAVIPLFVESALAGTPLVVHGDGHQSRDFSFVDNVVEANLLACQAEGVPGRVFNVACGDRHTLLDLIDLLAAILDRPVAVEHGPARLGDVRHSQADISRAQAVLGYRPSVSFAEGLRRTVAWIQAGRPSSGGE